MINPLQKITVRGEEREALITPSLFRIAKERGWRVEVKDTSDLFEVTEAYRKVIYCAVINAYEVRKWDNPNEQLDVTLMDIEVWSMTYPKEYAQMISDIVYLLTGKTKEEIAKDIDEKKKKKKNLLTLLGITKR